MNRKGAKVMNVDRRDAESFIKDLSASSAVSPECVRWAKLAPGHSVGWATPTE